MPTLLLIPTELERERLRSISSAFALAELCGFGPIAAGVQTASLLHERQPSHVVLGGIAGTYHPHLLPVGAACCFHAVAIHGVGAGEGDEFVSGGELGFIDRETETLPLQTSATVLSQPVLLSVCAASGNANAVEQKRRHHPTAVAEDMEGYGVALACSAMNIPLTIIRGISNVAGDRDKTNWDIDAALIAVAEAIGKLDIELEGQASE